MAATLYGIGATKAGTSWLYRYLDDHPQVHLRSVKEVHYWDHPTPESAQRYLGVLARQHAAFDQKAAAAQAKGQGNRVKTIARKQADIRALVDLLDSPRGDHAGYSAYLSDGQGEALLVGDVTPSYALCDEKTLVQMQSLRPGAKFLYLMRDPVARLWSHVRMMAERRAGAASEIPNRAARILRRVLEGQEAEITSRSDYAAVLGRVSRAVPAAQRMVVFYEQLFTQETVDRICAFLGLAPRAADFDRRVLESAPLKMTDDQRHAAARHLAPQYDYVADHYGPLPSAWAASRALT